MSTSLSHLFVHMTSLRASRSFYVERLGLELLDGTGEDGSGYMRLGGGGGFALGMEERAPAEVGAAGIELVLEVADVDTEYERLQQLGVAFEAGPTNRGWGARHCWLRDPDGYRISLYSASRERA
jgi:lactoylglutathione lyase